MKTGLIDKADIQFTCEGCTATFSVSVIGLTQFSQIKCPACTKRHRAKRRLISLIDRAFIAGFQNTCRSAGVDIPGQIDRDVIRFVRVKNRFPLSADEVEHTPLGEATRIIGVSNYQPAIRRCREGEQVTLVREPRNRHDRLAVAAISIRGDTIGYLHPDRALRQTILQESHAVEATIYSMGKAPERVNIGVELDVVLLGAGTGPIAERSNRTWSE